MEHGESLARLEGAIKYSFKEVGLLSQALTHRSYANEHGASRAEKLGSHNERLEFLGDALIDCQISAALFRNFADVNEGLLTRYRSALVREEALAEIADALDLGDAMRLGRGEAKSGGQKKPRLLASALEAMIGAVFVDGGYAAAASVVDTLFKDAMASLDADPTDAKSRFQERVQKLGVSAPTYGLLRSEGPEHDKSFVMQVEVEGRGVASGKGRNKAEATQVAARAAMELSDAVLLGEEVSLGEV